MHDSHHIKQFAHHSKLEERIVFFFVCMGVIAITYGIFYIVDFLPEKPTTTATTTPTISNSTTIKNSVGATTEDIKETAPEVNVSVEPLPLSIIFDSLDNKEVKVLNPKTDSVAALDAALLSGVVRHPSSADFENTGTILLLGHSSYLPVVHNKNFQAFNGIQKLVWGDTIRLRSADTEYVYSVDRVYEAKASDAEISIEKGVAKLTLATCNSFGTKDDRFVVEATLIDTHSIAP